MREWQARSGQRVQPQGVGEECSEGDERRDGDGRGGGGDDVGRPGWRT